MFKMSGMDRCGGRVLTHSPLAKKFRPRNFLEVYSSTSLVLVEQLGVELGAQILLELGCQLPRVVTLWVSFPFHTELQLGSFASVLPECFHPPMLFLVDDLWWSWRLVYRSVWKGFGAIGIRLEVGDVENGVDPAKAVG
jgi:hypothetical protein